MVPSTEQPDTSLIGRREAIRRAALLAGVALSPAWLSAIDQAARRATQGSRLTLTHAAIAGSVADRILPRTDTPGAADVGVPAFINLLYGDFMTPAERKMLTDGLNEVDAAAKAAHGGAFTTLSPDRQDTVLRAIARAEEGKDQGFFRLIRSATILGYFTSEPVGRNVLHYDPVPGRYEGCVPIEQVGRRNWTT
jgi:gluconate 2-dehydrogenase gamma chain